MQKLFAAILFCCICFSSNAQNKDSVTIGPATGSLLIVGGGTMSEELWIKFVQLAGGIEKANIVIVPTADEDTSITKNQPAERDVLQRIGVKNITVLHTRDAKLADTKEFAEPLTRATGVWFRGGRHWRLADAYLHTITQKAFSEVLERGGVIGGSSAGATIQGSFMVRGDTKGNAIMIGDHTEGFDFMHNTAIDQHFLKRNRMFDMVDVIRTHPNLLGIAIDESTAIVVQKNRFDVIGASYVGIYDIDQINGQSKGPRSQNSSSGPFYFLSRGQSFDLVQRRVTR